MIIRRMNQFQTLDYIAHELLYRLGGRSVRVTFGSDMWSQKVDPRCPAGAVRDLDFSRFRWMLKLSVDELSAVLRCLAERGAFPETPHA